MGKSRGSESSFTLTIHPESSIHSSLISQSQYQKPVKVQSMHVIEKSHSGLNCYSLPCRRSFGSSGNPPGTCDEPLRMSLWEARIVTVTSCLTLYMYDI